MTHMSIQDLTLGHSHGPVRRCPAPTQLPFNLRKRTGDYKPGADTIQIVNMKVSKGLELPVVALPGVGHMPPAGEDEKEAARVFYVAATRATHRLAMGVGGDGGFGAQISATEPNQFTNLTGKKND